MPNVEIHGNFWSGTTLQIYEKIRKAMQPLPFREEIIVTTVDDSSIPVNKQGEIRFLRILGKDKDKLDQLIEALMPINLDMEILPIDFIPKKDERN